MKNREHAVFLLTKDLNPLIIKGSQGVVVYVYSQHVFEVEFVNADGTNINYEGQSTFKVNSEIMQLV